jgi:hypothetical protein
VISYDDTLLIYIRSLRENTSNAQGTSMICSHFWVKVFSSINGALFMVQGGDYIQFEILNTSI